MLANLLPGIRELRAPLAAGYLWLLFAWLVLEDRVPSRDDAEGLVAAIYRLDDVASIIGAGVAVSFAAYLLGALSESLFARVFRGVERLLAARLHKKLFLLGETEFDLIPETLLAVSDRGARALETLAARVLDELKPSDEALHGEVESFRRYRDLNPPLARARETLTPGDEPKHRVGGTVWVPGSTDEMGERSLRLTALVGALLGDLQLVETRLIGELSELYSAADRLRAEAEFREAVIPPLAALVALVAFETSPTGVVALVPLVLLYWQGVRRRQARNDLLADALLLGRVEAPTIERLRLRSEAERRTSPARTTVSTVPVRLTRSTP